MRFEWDEGKRRANLRKHGLDFEDAKNIFDGPTFTVLDERINYGEERYLTLGLLRGLVFVVVHTESEQVIRIISARRANKHEEIHYLSEVAQ